MERVGHMSEKLALDLYYRPLLSFLGLQRALLVTRRKRLFLTGKRHRCGEVDSKINFPRHRKTVHPTSETRLAL